MIPKSKTLLKRQYGTAPNFSRKTSNGSLHKRRIVSYRIQPAAITNLFFES
jgi:hypothetical protein